MDIPPPPADIMEVHMLDGEKVEIPLDEIRPLIPEGCSYCIDMTAEFSDISVGVLEGRPEMNTLIVRTERGRRIVDEARKEGYLIVSDIPEKNLKHLQEAAANKKRRALLKAKQEGLVNGKDKNSCMRLRAEILENITA
jgi:coenzyme F420 hydrogenase subunit beta